jgi:EAL domain-containing protein (putative c-di-GMP-specific phosphodiesterase class I)
MNVPPPAASPDIAQLIREDCIETHFQPITSIRQKSIIGIEALSRARHEGALIAPQPLFDLAQEQDCVLELDRACRRAALRAFVPFYEANGNLILFINFSAIAVTADLNGPQSLIENVLRFGLDARNIALEILESEFKDAAALRQAVQAYRACGFLVALDDVGSGFANLDRIGLIKPDIIKIDRSLISGIDHDYYCREVFQSIVNLSEKIGGWVITEGVETENEAVSALELGADMLQGFYFARPRLMQDEALDYQSERIDATAERFKSSVLERLVGRRQRRDARLQALRQLAQALSGVPLDQLETVLNAQLDPEPIASITNNGVVEDGISRSVQSAAIGLEDAVMDGPPLDDSVAAAGIEPQIESACILDENARQITGTVARMPRVQKAKMVIFRPPPSGTDHSMKEHFYALSEGGIDPFESQPYVPLPSGDLCIAVSTFFRDADDCRRILCVHFRV